MKQKEVQLDLQRFEIFIFSSLLPSLPRGKMLEEKLTYRFPRYRLLGEKLFCSFESVIELNRGLRDSQTSINNKDLGLLAKKEPESICKGNIWSSFLRVLALSSVICRPNHLFYASVGFQK